MKKAVYHSGSKALKGVVIEEGKNADGPTVTLAETADQEPFVRGAPVSTTPQPGFAVITGEVEDEVAKLKAAAAALRKKATEAAKAAVNARKAADGAKGKANEVEMAKAAEEADEAAKKADTEADEAEAALK